MIRIRVTLLGLALALALPALVQPGSTATAQPAGPEPTHEAAGAATRSHGLTLGERLKYGPNFRHLDYVNPDAPKGGTLRLSAIGSFDSFNPFIIKGTPAAGIDLTYETLMTSPEDDMSAEYGLIAESVEVPDDLSSVTYNLRRDARFNDGTPITAVDVVFSFNLLKEKGAPIYRFYYANIARAQAIGRSRVQFTFTGPKNRELPQITGQLPVLSKAYWQKHDFASGSLVPPLGSGPYRVKTFEPGRYVEYERVADHWSARLPINRGLYNFQTIRFDYYRDDTVALEAFKAGQYDFRREQGSKTWATGYDFPALRDGRVVKEEVPNALPTGMQGFFFNLRREKFQDRALRHALGYAFDFEWSNKNLFFGQYTRTKSFFSNSELAASGLPSPAERALLEPFRGRIPDEVFTKIYEPPETDGSGNNRNALREATRILGAAGYTVKDNKLIDPKSGQPVTVEFLLVDPQFERVVAPMLRNMERLGVEGRIRIVDSAQYLNRVNAFDFDVIVASRPQSLSPGNEQRDFWSSAAADRQGSRNVLGLRNEVVDALVEKIIAAPNRAALITATRALDRVLLWGHYVVPHWHIRSFRLAYWNKFGVPRTRPPYGTGIMSWWSEQDRAAAGGRERPGGAAR